jgi:hypothetical protein
LQAPRCRQPWLLRRLRLDRFVCWQIVGHIAQAIFSFEVAVKVLAERKPLHYFTNRDNSLWNTLDFTIVAIGYEGTISIENLD